MAQRPGESKVFEPAYLELMQTDELAAGGKRIDTWRAKGAEIPFVTESAAFLSDLCRYRHRRRVRCHRWTREMIVPTQNSRHVPTSQ